MVRIVYPHKIVVATTNGLFGIREVAIYKACVVPNLVYISDEKEGLCGLAEIMEKDWDMWKPVPNDSELTLIQHSNWYRTMYRLRSIEFDRPIDELTDREFRRFKREINRIYSKMM